MSTVILIGFSCSGKSTFRKRLKGWMKAKAIKREIEFVDTDDLIAGEEDGIYRVFIARVKRSGDRSEAIGFIKEQERNFLKSFTPSSQDCLIAAGPLLPLYPEWGAFLKRTQAKCVWLTISAEKAYRELCERQAGLGKKIIDGKKLSDHWQFGCWNEGVVTYFHDSNRRWQFGLEDKNIAYISELINDWSRVYKEADLILDFRSVHSESDEAEQMLKRVYDLF